MDEENTSILAWTTTPWTLISNLALCINEKIQYTKIKVLDNNKFIIVGSSRLKTLFKDPTTYEVIKTFDGKELVGKKYTPLFDFAREHVDISSCFQILSDAYVTDSDGTGIVHLAPAFGEEDHSVCKNAGLPLFDPVNIDGNFIGEFDFISGINIKVADKIIIKRDYAQP